MTQCNTLNVKLSNSQLNKLKSEIKNGTGVTSNLSSNIIGESNDENNFPHKLLFTNTQVSRLHKTFVNNCLANIKLSKTQIHNIGQSGRFLGRLLGPVLKNRLPLIRNVLKPLAKSFLIPIGLTIHQKMFGSGFIILIISNEEMEDIRKIVRSFEGSGLLIKRITETIKNEGKNKKEDFLECY